MMVPDSVIVPTESPVPAVIEVTVPDVGVNHSNVPVPFDVLRACPVEPTAVGNVKEYDVTVPVVFNVTVPAVPDKLTAEAVMDDDQTGTEPLDVRI